VSADVVIVGAGVIGAATAFHLSLLGAGDVLVLEHRIRIPTTDQSPGRWDARAGHRRRRP